MKKSLFYFTLGSISILSIFQNCAGPNASFQSQIESDSIQHISDLTFLSSDNTDQNNQDQQDDKKQDEDDNSRIPNTDSSLVCPAGKLTWKVAGVPCEATYTQLSSNPNQQHELIDFAGAYVGKAIIKCVNKEVQLISKTCGEKQLDDDSGTKLKARMFKSQYTIVEGKAFAYTGATVVDVVYVCMQKPSDSNYPCINGDLTKTFREVPRPTKPNSNAQELIWESPSFYEISNFEFGSYEVFFMKKDSQGRLNDRIGSLRFNITLPSEVLFPGLSGSYTSRGKTIYYACPVDPDASVPGYKSYPLSNQNCYYK